MKCGMKVDVNHADTFDLKCSLLRDNFKDRDIKFEVMSDKFNTAL